MAIPKVSIIIPVYNAGDLLIKCLDSIKNQTLDDIEIICIDDGSNDDSPDILDCYAKNDHRFKVFHQKNLGAGASRNIAIDKVKGEFLMFVDSDDWIEKDTCEKLYYHSINLNSDLVLFDAVRHLPNNQSWDLIHFDGDKTHQDFQTFSFNYEFVKDKVLNAYFGVIWSKFYKSSFILENNIKFPNHKLYNDVEFHVKTMLLAKSISYYQKIFYHYNRIGQDSLQTVFVSSKDAIVFYDVMCGIREFLIDNDLFAEFNREFTIFTFKEFNRKLNEIDNRYKPIYFDKIKSFLISSDFSIYELNKISFVYLVFYIHVINSKSFEEFKFIQGNYNGEISLDYFDDVNYDSNDIFDYVLILENKLANLTLYVDEMEYYLNLFKQKALADKKTINNTCNSSEELMYLRDREKYLNRQNNFLCTENKYLKKRNNFLQDENEKLKNNIVCKSYSKVIKRIIDK